MIVSAALIDGGPGGVAVVKDVTRRRAQERERDEALADLARAQRIARLGSYSLDLASGTITGTPEMFRIFGIPATPDGTVPAERGRVPGRRRRQNYSGIPCNDPPSDFVVACNTTSPGPKPASEGETNEGPGPGWFPLHRRGDGSTVT